MAKSRDAFRTISEVSTVLDTPAHVLRFWESKFNQIKPVKRAGGRRYYRPQDLAVLAAIKDLLHTQGLSIKQTQKHLRDVGVKKITAEGQALLDSTAQSIDMPTNEEAKAADQTQAAAPAAAPEAAATPEAPKQEEPTQDAAKSKRAPLAKRQPIKDDPEQIDLFGGMDLPVTPPRDAPSLQILSAKPVPDTPPQDTPPEQKSATFLSPELDLPPPPPARADMPARILAALVTADETSLREKSKQIAPVLARLTSLRDELRHPW